MKGSERPASTQAAVLWALAGLVALGAALRFSTLGIQSYHHDEIITVTGVLPRGLLHTLRRVQESESNPPLYYVVAWAWSKLFGTGEVGLRSLSALLGVATLPVVFLAAREALDNRAGLIAAALAAANPMLIWYSQEARSYSMLVFFGALSLLFFLRSLRLRRERELACWAVASAAALCTHYFAGFQVAIEAGWLLVGLPDRRRATLAAVAATALVGVALVPLLLSQINATHIGWIAQTALPARLLETAVSFLAGETGHVIAEPPRHRYAAIPALAFGAGLALLATRSGRERWRRALPPLLVGAGVMALTVMAALVGKDYVIERNLLPALVPILVATAIGFSAERARQSDLPARRPSASTGWASPSTSRSSRTSSARTSATSPSGSGGPTDHGRSSVGSSAPRQSASTCRIAPRGSSASSRYARSTSPASRSPGEWRRPCRLASTESNASGSTG